MSEPTRWSKEYFDNMRTELDQSIRMMESLCGTDDHDNALACLVSWAERGWEEQ